MSKKEQSDANGAKSLLGANLFQDVSSVPKSSYAKQIVQNNRKAKFLKEYWDAGKGKRIVKLKYPSKHGNGRNGKVLVVWQFDPKGELMRNQAVQRHAREQLYPRGEGGHVRLPREGHQRFPRIMRFPRYSKKWERKLGLRKEK